LTSIALEVTVAGSAGAEIRMGIYKLDPATGAITLLLDAGVVDGTSIGVKTLTISQPVSQGEIIMPGAVNQGSPTTLPTFRSNSGHDEFFGGEAATISQTSIAGLSIASVTGALPASPTAPGVAGSGSVPRVLVMAAS